jgi:serine/alanine adding enzyme
LEAALREFLIGNDLDHHTWKEFVNNHPQGTIFHTPEMFEVFRRTHGHTPVLWNAQERDGEPLALLLPVQITLLNGPFRPFTTRALAYGSVLCAPGQPGRMALDELLKAHNQDGKRHLLFTELRNPYDLQDLLPVLDDHGFAYEEHLNFLIDLKRSTRDIWGDIRDSARRNIKKARRLEVQIEEVHHMSDIEGAYSVLKDVYKRIQVPLPDISLFQASFKVLCPKEMFKILLAKVKDEVIGVLCLLLYKGVIYYWYTGTLREYAAYRAGDLLVWHTLEYGSQNGYRLLDFGGGGKPGEPYGVRDFKAKFGGDLVNYGRNICVHAPTKLKVSQAGYSLLRRFL